MVPGLPAPPARAVLARRASMASAWPQLVLALAFFVPAFRECGDPKSPADYAGEDLAAAGLVVPPFALAAVLAFFTLAARKLQRPPPVAGAIGVAALLSLYPLGVFALEVADGHDARSGPVILLGAGACAVLACVVAGMRRRGWARWGWLGRGHLLTASPFGGFLLLTAITDAEHALLGAYVYVFAWVALVLIHASWLWALARRRARNAPRARGRRRRAGRRPRAARSDQSTWRAAA